MKTIAILVAHAGKVDGLRTLLDGFVAVSRLEPGNLRYDLWQDRTDPACFVLDALHDGADAVAAHRTTPHFRHYASAIASLAERTTLTLDPVGMA